VAFESFLNRRMRFYNSNSQEDGVHFKKSGSLGGSPH
jgi:hypothetical protein